MSYLRYVKPTEDKQLQLQVVEESSGRVVFEKLVRTQEAADRELVKWIYGQSVPYQRPQNMRADRDASLFVPGDHLFYGEPLYLNGEGGE